MHSIDEQVAKLQKQDANIDKHVEIDDKHHVTEEKDLNSEEVKEDDAHHEAKVAQSEKEWRPPLPHLLYRIIVYTSRHSRPSKR